MIDLDEHKLLAGRLLATRSHPYLAGALWAMTIVPTYQVPTMAVDRYWRCYVSPSFVAACSVGELAGAWLHEVGHLLRDHHARADRLWDRSVSGHGSQDPGVVHARQMAGGSWLDAEQPDLERLRMNLAMDCELNDDAQVGDDIALPQGSVRPRTFMLDDGQIFETYLRELPATMVEGHKVWLDCGSGARGGDAPWDLGPGEARPLSSAQAEVIRIRTAEQIKRGQGDTAGHWRRWADEVGRPTLDWSRLLRGAVRVAMGAGAGSGDHTFARPSRRSAALGGTVALPALTKAAPRVAVVIDTSGSVSDSELGAALAETAAVIRAAGGQRVTVYSCDSAVQTVQEVASARDIVLAGGGGTDLEAGMQRALAARPAPDVLVVLTDGHTRWPKTPPRIPVVVGVFGPAPVLDQHGRWRPRRPPEWATAVRIE